MCQYCKQRKFDGQCCNQRKFDVQYWQHHIHLIIETASGSDVKLTMVVSFLQLRQMSTYGCQTSLVYGIKHQTYAVYSIDHQSFVVYSIHHQTYVGYSIDHQTYVAYSIDTSNIGCSR